MRALASAARWLAMAIAVVAVIDPVLPIPGPQPPVLRIVSNGGADTAKIASAVRAAGFKIDPASSPAATLLVADRLPPNGSTSLLPRPTWIANAVPPAPNVRLLHVAAPASRLPGQALDVTVEVRAEGVRGKTTGVTLEDAGLPVASASHTWTGDDESWRATFQYLPPYTGAGRLRLTAGPVPDETSQADNSADLLVPAARGPVRVLILEAAVTWPALFVRRALEGESAFAISASQRAAKSVVTRAGTPPQALTRDSLAPYEVAVIGGPSSLRTTDVDALRWFAEARGGVVLFVPDERPAGNYLQLIGITAFDVAVLEEPMRIGSGLLASELAIPRGLPAATSVLAADTQRRPVVFSSRRGAGAVMFSGALDAWRHRGADEEAFARFWRTTIAAAATTVPPALQVLIEPAIARPGEAVQVSVRLRDSELPAGDRTSLTLDARAIDPQAKEETPLRLWPTAEPTVFSGEWRAPHAGTFNVTAAVNGLRADAVAVVSPDIVAAHPATAHDFELLARASGGRSFPVSRVDEMMRALKASYPGSWEVRRLHPMRSAWWCVPFAALLCVEWAVRRKRGLP